jgi:uncharacterized membrane protein
MEIISILVLIVLFILLIVVIINFSALNNRTERIEFDLMEIRRLISKNIPEKKVETSKQQEVQVKSPVQEMKVEPSEKPVEFKIKEEVLQQATIPPVKEQIKAEHPVMVPEIKKELEKIKVEKHSEIERDFEKFVGENLISKIGIITLVLGVGYFVKYAIDKDWINEYGRVAIGILSGGVLIAVAHFLRKSYKTFTSILTGGGLAVLYITIAFAFHQYHMFSQTSAFAILILITIFSVILSLIYDKKELAIFSQLGGYASPMMITTGDGNYIGLFAYILILNAGLIILAYYKRWHILNIIAYFFTLVIFGSWVFSGFKQHGIPISRAALVFATLFYVVFFLVNVLNNLKEKKPFNALEIGLILSNNLFYLIFGLYILHTLNHGLYQGLFTIIIGIYNFGWLLYLYKKSQIDKVFVYLLIALVMSFISLAIPIQLKGHSITMFWSAEMVILLWLSQKSGIRILKIGHLLIFALIFISLIMDWENFYSHASYGLLPVIVNKCFITGVVVIAALSISIALLRNEKEIDFVSGIQVKFYKTFLNFALCLFLYPVCFLELSYQMNSYYPLEDFRYMVYGVFNSAFISSLMLVAFYKKQSKTFKGLSFLAVFYLLVFVFFYYREIGYVRNYYLEKSGVTFLNYLFHYLYYPFIGAIIVLIGINRKNILPSVEAFQRIILWFLAIITVFIFSIETDNILLVANHASYDNIYLFLHKIHKVGYPILWALLAFVMMIWGMQIKNKDFRIISLSLFALIILKLFIVDVWDMTEGGRIAAFIVLGIVLLIVSFLYQRLKKLLIENKEEDKFEN